MSSPIHIMSLLERNHDRSQYHLLSISAVINFETEFHLSHISLCIFAFVIPTVMFAASLILPSLLAALGSFSRPLNTFYLRLVADHPAYRDSRVIKIPTKTQTLELLLWAKIKVLLLSRINH